MGKKKSIEEIYKAMDPIEHIILRPGMYIGSVKNEPKQLFIYSDTDDGNMMILKDVDYTPALVKLLDEIISNSCDEFRRPTNLGLTEIQIHLDKSGIVNIKDNGGIPVVKHKEAKVYIPEFIFGQLRTSSNYDDSENRDVIGTNGLGSKICNIFSEKFSIYTSDGKKSFFRSWQNNMRTVNDDLKIKVCKQHFTEINFKIDFSKFECGNEFSDDFVSIIEKRCIDAAASNIGLKIKFKYTDGKKIIRTSEWKFKSFDEYLKLYSNYIDLNEKITFKDDIMDIYIFPETGLNVTFVNGAECSKGTHVKAVRELINSFISDYMKTKENIEISNKNIDNKYSLFGLFKINNPTYDSQTKDQLTNQVDKFSVNPKYKLKLSDSFLKSIIKSEIKNIIIDWYKQKSEVEDQKTLRKLNKQAKNKLKNSDKFINANSKKLSEKELWIYEGCSASAGFRFARNPQTQAAYLLRGVILNTFNMTPSKIMENKELSDIVSIIGLQWGTEKLDVKKLNFGKIVIATDADFDGSHICGLLLSFFNKWPELFENKMICRSITPIIIAYKGNDIQKFYKLEDFKKKEKSLKGYKIKYAKGLGSLSNQEYKDMMQNPVYYYFTKDDCADINLNLWFNKNIAKERKNSMKEIV